MLTFCYVSCSFAFTIDTTERRNRINDSVTERFFVLKDNKDFKQGPYQALFKRRIIIARGNYANNRKTGIWSFFKPNGLHVQSFDYNKNELTFESPVDTLADVHYLIDKKFTISDTVTRPVKTGGVYYGMLPYLAAFQLPFDTMGVNTDNFNAYVQLLVSPLGRLAEYKIRIISAFYRYDQTFNLDVHLFNEEDRQFIPATMNNAPIVSQIMIKCYVTPEGKLDFY